jgi:hypothetical protein
LGIEILTGISSAICEKIRFERSQRADTEGNYMAAAEMSTILRFVASVPRLTFPPPPKPSPLGFHRAYLSLLDNENYLQSFNARYARQSIALFASCIFCFVRLAF